jgi:hypothetical protein
MKIKALKYLHLLIIILLSLLSASCDAPRKNPLDPENPFNIYHTIEGTVQTISLPSQPIPEVKILWPDQTTATLSNDAGKFKVETINPYNGWLFFEKDGYIKDSTLIQWKNQKKITVDMLLNSLPFLDSLFTYSVILNRYPSLQNEQIVIETKITDNDNDIDTVFLQIPNIHYNVDLPFNVSSKWYQRTLTTFDLNIEKIEQIVGYHFQIQVKDIFDHQMLVGKSTITRVIRDEVLFISPVGNDTTSGSPTLIWENFKPGFSFTYSLQIFTSEITPQLVWEKNRIDSQLTSFLVDSVLSPGEYFWVIWAIDEFKNRTRSKPASFVVK